MRRRTTWTLLGAILALWLATAGAALSAAGDLDGTFGTGGRANIDLGADEDLTALVLQADGRIIVGGDRLAAGPDGNDGIVTRLTPQGALDPTYGGGTFSRLNFGGVDRVTGVAQQSNGRIIAVGFTNAGANGFAVGLLGSAGTLDPAFGSGNGIYRPAFANASFSAVAVEPDDRVVIAGTIPGTGAGIDTDMTVVRLGSGGAIDLTYGGGFGWSRVGFPGQAGFEGASGIGLQADGRIILAGFTTAPGIESFGIARLLNPQGTFDSTFGPANNGTATVATGPIGLNGPALAMAPDGGIVLAGFNSGSNAIVVRQRGTGLPDTGFSDDGTAIGAPGAFGGVAVQRDGKIVAVGGTPGAGGGNDVLVMRFQPNGQPDSTFSGDGKVVIDLGGGTEGARAVAIQPDGRIVVGASTDANTDLVVLRLQGDATIGTGPGAGGGPGGVGGGPGGGGAAPICGGRAATIIGSAGSDRLTGTANADVIAGLAGNDTISGLGGDDVVCGGAGVDTLKGGAGADRLLGGGGADRLLGGPGRDRLLGGAGADRLVGGGGIDVLTGGAGRNVRIQ